MSTTGLNNRVSFYYFSFRSLPYRACIINLSGRLDYTKIVFIMADRHRHDIVKFRPYYSTFHLTRPNSTCLRPRPSFKFARMWFPSFTGIELGLDILQSKPHKRYIPLMKL